MPKQVKIKNRVNVSVVVYLLVVISVFASGAWLLRALIVPPPIQTGPTKINVAVMKAVAADPNLVANILKLISEKPKLDLIVTPEYSLIKSSYNLDTPRIKATCKGGKCILINVSNGINLIRKINEIAAIAKKYKINIVLGTLPLEEGLSAANVNLRQPVYNSLLVIDNRGIIVAKKLKTTGSDWCNPLRSGYQGNCANFPEISVLAKQKALENSLPISLTNREGMVFKVFTSICADINDSEMAQRAVNANVDLFIWPTVNGSDARAYQTTLSIQSNSTFTWPVILSRFNDLYITQLWGVNPNGFFLSADVTKSGLGIISLNKIPFSAFTDSDYYLYGELIITRKIPK